MVFADHLVPELLKSRLSLVDPIRIKNQKLENAAKKLLIVSDYAFRQLPLLNKLLEEDDCKKRYIRKDYDNLFEDIIEAPLSVYCQKIRELRHSQFLRLILREYAELSTVKETIHDWSIFADSAILATVKYIQKQLTLIYGHPEDAKNLPVHFCIIGMGKLGGNELNFSSDIDLIFAYSKEGFTNGEKSISNQEYFYKLVKQFISIFQNITKDGFVFRVDLRLRPNGDSGPLVPTLTFMENYYQEQGRDWERYAMVKARPISNYLDDLSWFSKLINPFVYRRYVDYSVIESLRSMKSMIEREVQLNPMLNDIKRGWGGIREIEFTIQCLQLIRGGRLTQLQQQNALKALYCLRDEMLLEHTLALEESYIFLRKLENTLQLQNDQQTHQLPNNDLSQTQVMLGMDLNSWTELLKKLQKTQRVVTFAFHAVLGGASFGNDTRILDSQLLSLWQGHIETTMANNLLTSLGYTNSERCYQMLNNFRHSAKCRRLSQAARLRLERFMVILLHSLTKIKNTDLVLLPILNLLENIVGRSAYIALLTENPSILDELLYLFANSPFISEMIIRQPFLLEVLIDQNKKNTLPNRQKLKKILHDRLKSINEEETYNEYLRQFKLSAWLIAARLELKGECQAVEVSKFLSNIAEIVIEEVFINVCENLKKRNPQISEITQHFGIVAYGKLGSREMNYDSDVDLVFLHNVSIQDEHLIIRLTQKMLNMLSMRTQSGILYNVDTRLRPSGSSGLLVSRIDAYIQYQLKDAWTWEHQALLRTRLIYGSQNIKTRFNKLKLAVLNIPRRKIILKKDVINMKNKIQNHTGLLDFEFLLQYLILAHPNIFYVKHTHSLEQIQFLKKENIITNEQAIQLRTIYFLYHQLLHEQVLKGIKIKDKYVKEIEGLVREIMG